jgi:hypothetical protein
MSAVSASAPLASLQSYILLLQQLLLDIYPPVGAASSNSVHSAAAAAAAAAQRVVQLVIKRREMTDRHALFSHFYCECCSAALSGFTTASAGVAPATRSPAPSLRLPPCSPRTARTHRGCVVPQQWRDGRQPDGAAHR